jgi:hypothetical protein
VIYISGLRTVTPPGHFISAAVTIPPFFFERVSHSIPVADFSITRPLRFRSTSRIESRSHGNVVYSCVTPGIFTPVTRVPGIDESITRRREFPRVTPYPLGRGPMRNVSSFCERIVREIFGTPMAV